MGDSFGLGLLPSDVRQARLLLGGMRVEDPYWKALLVATWLKGDAANRAKLERIWPELPDEVKRVESAARGFAGPTS